MGKPKSGSQGRPAGSSRAYTENGAKKPDQVTEAWSTEVIELSRLKPHPKNYRKHPEEQLAHIQASLEQHGVYRNVVVARDFTILAGHGVVEAATRLGRSSLPVKRLDVDPNSPAAMKILVADNELGRFAEDDDRLLSELLKSIKDEDVSKLLGTGYDDAKLAALLLVTRPAVEIKDFDEAAEWVGMPEYEAGEGVVAKLVISFRTREDFDRFVKEKEINLDKSRSMNKTTSTWWPWREWEDRAATRFEEAKSE